MSWSASVPAAEPREFTRAWTRADGAKRCPSQGAVVNRVRERLGYEPLALEAASAIEVSIVRTGDELVAEIIVRAKAGEGRSSRTIRSQVFDCTAPSDALVLAIAMIIDPD